MLKENAMFISAPIFCLFCMVMVYNEYINRRHEPLVEIIVMWPEDIYRAAIEEKVTYGAKKEQLAKKNKQSKKTVSPRSNESKNH